MVEAYGSMSPLNQMANITTPDARTLSIQPWDKSLLQAIEKSIMAANIGLTPQSDGTNIRLNIPPLTEERRRDLVKQSKGEAENCRVALRSVRKDSNDKMKKLKADGLTEDSAKQGETDVQNITNEFIAKVDKHLEVKEKEIMTV